MIWGFRGGVFFFVSFVVLGGIGLNFFMVCCCLTRKISQQESLSSWQWILVAVESISHTELNSSDSFQHILLGFTL